MTKLEKRRRHHQSDMVQVFKIINEYDNVEKYQWFNMAAHSSANTRQASGRRTL
jgi:hypothetical protein